MPRKMDLSEILGSQESAPERNPDILKQGDEISQRLKNIEARPAKLEKANQNILTSSKSKGQFDQNPDTSDAKKSKVESKKILPHYDNSTHTETIKWYLHCMTGIDISLREIKMLAYIASKYQGEPSPISLEEFENHLGFNRTATLQTIKKMVEKNFLHKIKKEGRYEKTYYEIIFEKNPSGKNNTKH